MSSLIDFKKENLAHINFLISLLKDKFNEALVFEEAISSFNTLLDSHSSRLLKKRVFNIYEKELSSENFQLFVDIFEKLEILSELFLKKECQLMLPLVFAYSHEKPFYVLNKNNLPVPADIVIRGFNPVARFYYFYKAITSCSLNNDKIGLNDLRRLFPDFPFSIIRTPTRNIDIQYKKDKRKRYVSVSYACCGDECFTNKLDILSLSGDIFLPFRILFKLSNRFCGANTYIREPILWINNVSSLYDLKGFFNENNLPFLKNRSHLRISLEDFWEYFRMSSFINFILTGNYECFLKSKMGCEKCVSEKKKNKFISSTYDFLELMNRCLELNYNISLNFCPFQN